jgi:hypothetical protein
VRFIVNSGIRSHTPYFSLDSASANWFKSSSNAPGKIEPCLRICTQYKHKACRGEAPSHSTQNFLMSYSYTVKKG